ncbi:hypothetical protein MIDIC_490006 [Alphaproteobacteria bacterium]
MSKSPLLAVLLTLMLILMHFSSKVVYAQAILHHVNEGEFIEEVSHAKSDVKLIFIFSSWCPHCKKALAAIKPLYQFTSQHKLQFFFFSIDSDLNSLEKFAHTYPEDIDIYHISSGDKILKMFKHFSLHYTNHIPHYAILDKDNMVILDEFCGVNKVIRTLKDLLRVE